MLACETVRIYFLLLSLIPEYQVYVFKWPRAQSGEDNQVKILQGCRNSHTETPSEWEKKKEQMSSFSNKWVLSYWSPKLSWHLCSATLHNVGFELLLFCTTLQNLLFVRALSACLLLSNKKIITLACFLILLIFLYLTWPFQKNTNRKSAYNSDIWQSEKKKMHSPLPSKARAILHQNPLPTS